MHKAFTMIELIFVIVIIGILSAVAIPKFAATRDDAKIAAIAQKIGAAVEEIASGTVASGTFSYNMIAKSNTVSGMIAQHQAAMSGSVLNIKMHTVADCITLQVVTSATDANISVGYGNAGSDAICAGLQDIVRAQRYTMRIKGKTVIY